MEAGGIRADWPERNPGNYSTVWNSILQPANLDGDLLLMTPSADPSLFLPLAPHAFQILLSLLDRDLHGYSLIKDIEGRTGGEMMLGTSTVYAAIKRMVQDGLLEEADPPQTETSGGPRRRYYRITAFGRRVARAEGLRIRRLQQMVAESSLLTDGETSLTGEVKQ